SSCASWSYPRSEGHVDAADEVAHRRLGQKVGHTVVELADGVQLGVGALVVRPGHQVATGHGEAQAAGADAGCPLRGSEIRHRNLAQLHEPSVLIESGLVTLQRSLRRRLVGERGPGQPDAGADAEQAAEALRGVVLLVPEPPVEQSVDPYVREV